MIKLITTIFLICFSSFQSLAHLQVGHSHEPSESQKNLVEKITAYNKTKNPDYLPEIKGLIESSSDGYAAELAFIRLVPADGQTLPYLVELADASKSHRENEIDVINSILNSGILRNADRAQIAEFSTLLNRIEENDTANYRTLRLVEKSRKMVETGDFPEAKESVAMNEKSVKELAKEKMASNAVRTEEMGVVISSWRNELSMTMISYDVHKDDASLQKINDLWNEHREVGRTIARSLEVDAKTFPMILIVASTQGDLNQSGTQGLAIMRLAKSDYLKTAPEAELDQFTDVLKQVEMNSGGNLSGFALDWIVRARRTLAEIETERAAGNPEYQPALDDNQAIQQAVLPLPQKQSAMEGEQPSTFVEDTVEIVNDGNTVNSSKAVEIQQEHAPEGESPADNGLPWLPIGIGAAALLAALAAAKIYKGRGR